MNLYIKMIDVFCRKSKSFVIIIVYTDLILAWLYRKLLPYRNSLEPVPGTNQYWAMSVMFLA